MEHTELNRSRLIVGIAMIAFAVFILVFAKGDYSIAGAVAFAVIGLVSIAISRRR